MGHVRYTNILIWLRGFQVKLLYLVLFSLYPLRDKKNLKDLQFWPESLGAMLEYWYIERGLLSLKPFNSKSKSSPSDFWLWSRVSEPGPPHLYSTSMAAACMLVPAPTLPKAKRSCAVSSFSEAARNVWILGRARCHNHYWNMRCLSMEINAGWYHCSCVEKSESELDDGRAPALLRKEYIR